MAIHTYTQKLTITAYIFILQLQFILLNSLTVILLRVKSTICKH